MNASLSTKRLLASRTAIWLAVAAGVLLFVGANAHLVYVAVTSQPGCVAHQRAGDHDMQAGSFAAAQSSCSPESQSRGAD